MYGTLGWTTTGLGRVRRLRILDRRVRSESKKMNIEHQEDGGRVSGFVSAKTNRKLAVQGKEKDKRSGRENRSVRAFICFHNNEFLLYIYNDRRKLSLFWESSTYT